MKKIQITTLILLINGGITFGQAITNNSRFAPTIFSASPNASSLGTYGQIPVNLFNGMPSISVDLYTLKVDNFKMPITASYHLASIKPEEKPGWLGLGWNLNCGGAITRIVHGGVDEVMVQNGSDHTAYSYYNHYDRLNAPDWYSNAKLQSYDDFMTSLAPAAGAPSAFPAPDEFMFNVNGLSGSFYKNHNGAWIVKSNKKIDIQINEELKTDFKLKEKGNNIHNTRVYNIKRIFYGFTLKTDDGTQYVFGKNPFAIEFTTTGTTSIDGHQYHSNFVAKTWYLTKIILPNNKEITFDYKTLDLEEEDFNPATEDVINKAVYKQYISTRASNYTVSGGPLNQSAGLSNLQDRLLERSFVVYLDKVTAENIEIQFNRVLSNDLKYDLSAAPWDQYVDDYNGLWGYVPAGYYQQNPNWFKLDNFRVRNTLNNSQVYLASFNYVDDPTKRLALSDITETGTTSGSNIKKYSFQYNPMALPPYNSLKVDHWGYYNNTNFLDITPLNQYQYTNNQFRTLYSATRNPNPAVMQAETLTKITYPTGGYTEFFYEPHDFSKVVDKTPGSFVLVNAANTHEIAGGLRIKKIVSTPADGGTPITKEYLYVKDYKNNDLASSGILGGRPQYIEEGSTPGLTFFNISSNSLSTLNSTNGNHITYSKVVEKLSDNSYTEFTYANHDNGFIDKPASNYGFNFNENVLMNSIVTKIAFNSLEAERGNLLSEKKYNSQNQIVEETNNYYDTSNTRFTDEIRSIDFTETVFGTVYYDEKVGTITNHIHRIVKMAAQTIYSHQVNLLRTENIKYDLVNNSSIATNNVFTYSNAANHHHLKTEELKTLTNETLISKYFYLNDSETALEPYRPELISKNMVGVPLIKQTYRNADKLSEETTKYFPFPSAIPGNPMLLPQFIFTAKGNDPLEKKITYTYDSKGNTIQYILENDKPVSVIWGYNNSLPIAKLDNIQYSSIPPNLISDAQNASNGNNETLLLNALNSLRSLPDVMVTTCTYFPLIGIKSITDPKGEITTFSYDEMNRLKWTKDKDGNIMAENKYHYKN